MFQSGAGNGLSIALDGGFAVESVQITAVQAGEVVGPFTPTGAAPSATGAVDVSGGRGHLSISGVAQSSVLVPEGGTITWDAKNGAAEMPSTNTLDNWAPVPAEPKEMVRPLCPTYW